MLHDFTFRLDRLSSPRTYIFFFLSVSMTFARLLTFPLYFCFCFFLLFFWFLWQSEWMPGSNLFYTQSSGRIMFAKHGQTSFYSILDELGIFHSQSQILKWCCEQGSNPSCDRQRLILSPLNYSIRVLYGLRSSIFLQHLRLNLFKINI